MEETFNLVIKIVGKAEEVHEFDAEGWNGALVFAEGIIPKASWSNVGDEIALGAGVYKGEEVDLALFKKYSDTAAEFGSKLHTYERNRL